LELAVVYGKNREVWWCIRRILVSDSISSMYRCFVMRWQWKGYQHKQERNMQPKIRRELHQITPLRLPNVDKVEA
jgi:hypothetical protein